MNTVKLILTICAALMMVAVVGTPVLADTIEWSGSAQGDLWATGGNWVGGVPAGPGDTALFPDTGMAIDPVEISSADAQCEILDIRGGLTTLTIKGQRLTLGDGPGETTTHTLHGIIQFQEDGNDRAELALRGWDIFEGGGAIQAAEADNSSLWPRILRAADTDGGFQTKDDLNVRGHIEILCSVKHDADGGGAFFGTDAADDVMKFGNSTATSPAFEISSTTLNNTAITGFDGTIEFHKVEFAANCPSWEINGLDLHAPVFIIADEGVTDFATTNDISMNKWGVLDIRQDFDCTGKLLVTQNCKVKLTEGHLATFLTP